ncbi:hypothetical protein LINGRAHAP2_LOCUS32366 [Linum grandiflorum]
MAAVSSHARSKSVPIISHPLVSEIDDQVCRLRQSQAASTSSSSICQNLNGLQVLYDCVDTLLQLPLTQQKCFNELLDGSLSLLDLCNTAKDTLSQMKDSVAELQSAIRRKQQGEATTRYINSRKTVKKTIHKVFKGIESKKSVSSADDVEAITVLREAESVVGAVLERLLSFISQSNSKPSKSWTLVSKLVAAQPRVTGQDEANANEFAEVDASLKSNKSNEEVQVHLKNLQLCIQDLEVGVESLFRRLIKTRASILNNYNL